MPSRDKPNGDSLLQHLPEYGVVLCKACKFAVQPQALPSHLLRHQIYRNERRQLLDRLSKLGLRQPDDVPIPSPNTAPVVHLPVHQGYICLSAGCTHSCVSQKRMCQHWSEHHDEHDSKNVQARPATLQTFFRGNKIRYFEVNGSAHIATPESNFTPPRSVKSMSPARVQQIVSPRSQCSDETDSLVDITPTPTLDLQALRYLHHFTVTPCLKPQRGDRESKSFWAETIPREALRHPFLMYCLLGFAALHLAVEAPDHESYRQHRAAATHYEATGLTDFRAAMRNPQIHNSTALVAYARMIGTSRLMRCLADEKHAPLATTVVEKNDLSQVSEFLHMLRGGVEMLLSLQHLLPRGSDFILTDGAMDGMREIDDQTALEKDMQTAMNVPAALFNHIDSLPRTLASMHLLDDPNDMHAANHASAALLASAARSYASNDLVSLWNGVETFLHAVPDYFVRMLGAGKPWALVVFAHWCLLLRRLEPYYWYFKGTPARLLRVLMANMSPELANYISNLVESS